jgi:hypothetical protein
MAPQVAEVLEQRQRDGQSAGAGGRLTALKAKRETLR